MWIVKGVLLGILLFIVGGISYVGIRIGIGFYRVAGTAGGTQYDIRRFRLLHSPVLWAVLLVAIGIGLWIMRARATRTV